MLKKALAPVITALLVLLPGLALAHAGLSELDDTGALLLLVSVAVGMAAVPFSIHGTWDFDWYFVFLQIPFIICMVGLVARSLKRKRASTLAYILLLPLVYGGLTLATNFAGVVCFRADHSDYFRKEKEMESFFIRHSEKPAETEIVEALGEPFAAELFPITSSALPRPVTDSMSNSKLEAAYILSYIEKCRGRKGMEERTYYIILDPTTHRYVTRTGIYDEAVFKEKWPRVSVQ
ncbi:MAG TPA: hypothetical protein VJ550_04615 [Geomonas sp.]|nr:hypothetical protein [Geomonas sp.]